MYKSALDQSVRQEFSFRTHVSCSARRSVPSLLPLPPYERDAQSAGVPSGVREHGRGMQRVPNDGPQAPLVGRTRGGSYSRACIVLYDSFPVQQLRVFKQQFRNREQRSDKY